MPSTAPPDEGDAAVRPLPGDPVLVELDTDRARVVRLAEVEPAGERGQLQIASGVAGAMVAVDGDEPVSLPLSIELSAGAHQLIVTCPDASIENIIASIEPGSTVHVRVCNAPVQGP